MDGHSSKSLSASNIEQEEEDNESYQKVYQHFAQLVTELPRIDVSAGGTLHCYDGWYGFVSAIAGAMAAQKYFKALSTDVLVATLPKAGTTWIKALIFATINRGSGAVDCRRFLESHNPHECIPFLEVEIYTHDNQAAPDLSGLPAPRLFSTHLPIQSLPASVVDSGCKVVYLGRNPKDNFVSTWHFFNKIRAKFNMEPVPLEEAFDSFCEGFSIYGPYWEHLLGYWKAHVERPQQVLFIKYEELKEEPVAQVRRLAEFLGCPFSEEEEKEGVVDDIIRLCAIENLANLEVNKSGSREFFSITMENSSYFRRGVVGDWRNHLTPEMGDRLEKITEEKFRGYGLTF